MHNVTAPIGKYESALKPFITEQGFFTVLLLFQFLKNVAKRLGNCHLANTAYGLWKLYFWLLSDKLYDASADIHSALYKIYILPL